MTIDVTDLIVSVSGSRWLPGEPDLTRLVTGPASTHLGAAAGFVTGACVGIDALVGATLADAYPDARHTVIVPADRSRVIRWWSSYSNVSVIEMPAWTGYAARNAALVAQSEVLIAWPRHPEDDPHSTRSGAWQTVRMARHKHRQQPAVLILEDPRFGSPASTLRRPR